jgi:hypothetical protein
MPNIIKYTTGSESLAFKKNNFYIGVGDVGKGDTSSSGYYNGYAPPTNGYTIYLNKESGGPSIYVCSTDSEVISITNRVAVQSFTTIIQCLEWYRGQTDKMIVNRDIENIPTSGLTYVLDPGFTGSYPRTGTTAYNITSINLNNNIYNGSLQNGVSWTSASGGTFSFDGTDDRITIYNNSTGKLGFTDTMTVCMWWQWTADSIGVGNDIFLGGFDSGVGARQLNMYRNPWWGDNDYAFLARCEITGGDSLIIPSWKYVKNNWYWIAGSLRAGGGYTVRLNGTTLATGTIANWVRWWVNFEEIALNGRGLGPVSGNMGPLLLYNRGLSDSELSQIYNAQKGRFGL